MNTGYTLYLCEKPSQAKLVANCLGAKESGDACFLSDGIRVTWGYGHLQDLAAPDHYSEDMTKDMALPILPESWAWITPAKHKEHFANIGELMNGANSVVIATDPDEEGEVIGRQIIAGHNYKGKVSRVWVSALNPEGLSKALNNPIELTKTDKVFNAGLIRRKMDWLFGMNLSRKYNQPIGRVKARLMSEVVKRERAINQFKPGVDCQYVAKIKGETYTANGKGLRKNGLSSGACVAITSDFIQISPPLPYSFSDLMLDACSNGMSLSGASIAAQKLYEAGAISYPRTSSNSVAGASNEFAAHAAITAQTDQLPKWIANDDDCEKLFNLVHLNGVMNELGAATLKKVVVEFDFHGESYSKEYVFLEDDDLAGWMLCKQGEMDKYRDKYQQEFKVGEKYTGLFDVNLIDKAAPEHFTEASLFKKMVDENIGTASTRVSAIASLSKNELIEFKNNNSGEFEASSKAIYLVNQMSADIFSGEMDKMVTDAIKDSSDSISQEQSLVAATKWLIRQIYQ